MQYWNLPMKKDIPSTEKRNMKKRARIPTLEMAGRDKPSALKTVLTFSLLFTIRRGRTARTTRRARPILSGTKGDRRVKYERKTHAKSIRFHASCM